MSSVIAGDARHMCTTYIRYVLNEIELMNDPAYIPGSRNSEMPRPVRRSSRPGPGTAAATGSEPGVGRGTVDDVPDDEGFDDDPGGPVSAPTRLREPM